MDAAAIRIKALLLFLAALAVVGLVLFVPAGTPYYWQAWAYIALVFIPASLVILYFLDKDPEFLERRMKTKEKEAKQQLVMKLGIILFVIGFLIPGLNHRFGWSDVPLELLVAADVCVLLGYLICFLAFRENSYAGRTIEVVKGQKVISTGPYAIIRHPLYFGALLMYLATPMALGSYWALPPFLLIVPVMLFRILNEEEVLRRGLPGYEEYCQKTRYRLLPYIW